MGNVNINRRPRWWDKTHADVMRARAALRAADNLAWAREHGPAIIACVRMHHPEWLDYIGPSKRRARLANR